MMLKATHLAIALLEFGFVFGLFLLMLALMLGILYARDIF